MRLEKKKISELYFHKNFLFPQLRFFRSIWSFKTITGLPYKTCDLSSIIDQIESLDIDADLRTSVLEAMNALISIDRIIGMKELQSFHRVVAAHW